jgi:hypothetical protein
MEKEYIIFRVLVTLRQAVFRKDEERMRKNVTEIREEKRRKRGE